MKTTTVEAAAPTTSQTRESKKEAFVSYENASTAERRKRAEVVFGSIVRNLSDEDLAKYTVSGIDMDTEYKKKEVASLAATEKQLAAISSSLNTLPIIDKREQYSVARPADFADYDLDTIEAQAKVVQDVTPIRRGVTKRLGLSWPRGGLMNNAFALAGTIAERRNIRRQNKLDQMAAEEQLVFLDQWHKNKARIRKAGAITLGLTLSYLTFKTGIDGVGSLFDGPSADSIAALPIDTDGDKRRTGDYNVVLMNDEEKLNPFDEAYYKLYNTSDSSFLDYDNKEYRGDFGPALKASEKDGTMPAGFADWMERMKHEPNGVANLVSGLGMDGHDGSMADRNNLADFLDSDSRESRIAHAKHGFAIETILRDENRYSVELIDLTSYDSTYMYDDNGNLVIGKKDGLNLGGTAFEIIDKKTGEKTYWRTDCGGFQQVWPREEAPVAPAPVERKTTTTTTYAPEGGPKPRPERPVATTPPTRITETPPPTTTTTVPPVTTPPTTTTEIPPVTTAPKESRYGDNGFFDSEHGSGELGAPAEVEQEEATEVGRDTPDGAANGPIVDRPEVRDAGDETGGRDTTADADTQDTSGNGSEGSGQGDDPNKTNNGEASSK